MSERRKRLPHVRWVELMTEQEQSGLSVDAFCQERGLGVASFHHHRARMRKEEKRQGGFVEIQPSGSGLRLVCGQLILELDRDFDAETLKRFLAVVS